MMPLLITLSMSLTPQSRKSPSLHLPSMATRQMRLMLMTKLSQNQTSTWSRRRNHTPMTMISTCPTSLPLVSQRRSYQLGHQGKKITKICWFTRTLTLVWQRWKLPSICYLVWIKLRGSEVKILSVTAFLLLRSKTVKWKILTQILTTVAQKLWSNALKSLNSRN